MSATKPLASSGGTAPDISVTSGALVLQSTSSVSSDPVLMILDDLGVELLRVRQDGRVGIATATPSGLFTVGDATMVVTDSGAIGIGTAIPSKQVEITGDMLIGGAAHSTAYNSTPSAGNGNALAVQAGGGGGGFGSGLNFSSSYDGGSLTIAAGGAGHFGAGGNLLLTAGDAFDTGSVGGSVLLTAGGYDNWTRGHIAFRIGGGYPFGIGNPLEIMRIASIGYVGIGTTDPEYPLDASGDVRVSGQVIAVGTMTVQGSAFSVGGATFSIVGGSVSVAGLFKPSAAGIQWADGSRSTTAWAGGAGNAVLSATQTFSGANSFTSAVIVGSKVYTATATYGAALRGGWSVVASTNPSAASALSFTGIISSYTHRVTFNLYWGTGGELTLRVNNDSTSRYRWSGRDMGSDGAPSDPANNNDSDISLTSGWTVGNGGPAGFVLGTTGVFQCMALPNGRSDVRCWGETQYARTNDTGHRITGWNGHKMPAASWSEINLLSSAGTFSGQVYLEAFVPPIDP